MFDPALIEKIEASGIIAVVVIDRAEDAAPLARALLEGGVPLMELTLRTPAALDAIRQIRRIVPEMTVGAGTVLSPRQVEEALAAGAAFGVAPGTNPTVLKAAKASGLSFAPGVMTPSDIEAALEQGCQLLKFFPAESCGGVKTLKAITAPYAHLGLRFIPLGGLTAGNIGDYLDSPQVIALGGSWIAPREMIAAHAWETITNNAAEAVAAIRKAREP